MIGGPGNDRLHGAGGNDSLFGGLNDDTYLFANALNAETDRVTEKPNEGTDSIDFGIVTTSVGLRLDFSTPQKVNTNRTLQLSSGNVIENATGGSASDSLGGNGLNNILIGGPGNDRLHGAGGNDSLFGGLNDDTYLFANALNAETDRVTEKPNEGTDWIDFGIVTTSVGLRLDFSTPQKVNTNRTLQLSSGNVIENATGGSASDSLGGNGLNNILIGGPGNDHLHGAGGNDSLFGGLNDDTYLFANALNAETDRVTEKPNEGTDSIDFGIVTTSVGLRLDFSTPQKVNTNRTLQLSSGNVIENATGDQLDSLGGNGLNNILIGGPGNDRLHGAGGNDSLFGGVNDDTYLFANALNAETDRITEKPNEGTDSIDFGIVTSAVTLRLDLATVQTVHTNRTLQLDSADAFENVTGGSSTDKLTGNALNNLLRGNGEDDVLRGGPGDDTLYGDSGTDDLDGEAGFDIVYGGEGNDAIIGEKIDGNTLPLLPPLADVDVPRANEGFAVTLPELDADGDPVNYVAVSANSDVVITVNTDGLWIDTADDFIGSADITVTAEDGRGLSDSRTFSVVARNLLPEIAEVPDVSRLKDTGSFYVPFKVTDADGDPISRTFSSSDSRIALALEKNSSGEDELRVTPDSSFVGTATITMTAGDGFEKTVSKEFELSVGASVAVFSFNATIAGEQYFVRLDDAGNVYLWHNRSGDVNAVLIAENTKSISPGTEGKLFRLGLDGSLNRRNADGTWTDYSNAAPNITRIHAVDNALFLIPDNGGTLGVLNQSTGDINASLIAGTVQNEIAAGNLHTLDSSGNLYVNGNVHLGPQVFSGPLFLYFAAVGRVREIAVAHNKAYYMTADKTLYQVLGRGPLDSVRRTDYSGVLRIRGLDKTLYVVDRTGYQNFWEDGALGGAGASAGIREKFASDELSGYELGAGKLYRIPAGTDESPIYLTDGVADIIGHAGRLYRLDADGSLYRRGLSGGYESLGTGVRKIYEVARHLFIFRKNGQLETIVDGNLHRIATGVRQFSHSGDFYAGQPYVLYEDGRVAQIDLTSMQLTVIGGSTDVPYSAIAVGDGILLALQGASGKIYRWNGSSWLITTSPFSNPGKALTLVDANGIAAALYENKTLIEWKTNNWIIASTNYDPTDSVIGIDFTSLASDQDRVFAADSNGDIWTIPLNREQSSTWRRGDWLLVSRPLNTTNIVYQLTEAGGRIYARQAGTIFEFSDVKDYTDKGDWKAVGGAKYSTGSPYYWDVASAGGDLFVRDAYDNARVWKYSGTPGSWIDVSGNLRFNDIGTSTEGNLVGKRAPNNAPIAYLGNSWEETTLLWRRGRVLTISGRNLKDDYLKLSISGENLIATVNDPNGQQVFGLVAAGATALKSFTFLKSEIDQVVFHGLGGNDTVELDLSWNSYVPVIGYGGAGEDHFTGRVGYDQFFGGEGHDTITWLLDLNAYLNGAANAINTQADMVGDHIIVDVVLGKSIQKAFEEMHQFITDRLRPVTQFLNSNLVSIKALNFRITWRQAISKLNGLKELVRLHDELTDLISVIDSLPIRDGILRLGEFEVTGTSFSSITGSAADHFSSLNEDDSIRKLKSYGISLPFLLDGKELVKAVVGVPIELVTINVKLSTWLSASQLDSAGLKKTDQGIEPKDAISLSKGVIFLGPVPVQWELKFNYGFDLGLIAGLDTRGITMGGLSKLHQGLYMQSFMLKGYGKLIGEAGWDAGLIMDAMPDLSFVELVAPRAELVGEIGVGQTYTYSNGGKMYLFASDSPAATITVTSSLFGSIRIEAEIGIRAKGWTADALEGAEDIIQTASDAYYEVYENIVDFFGTITGQKVTRKRRPEFEIKKEVKWEFNLPLAHFERPLPAYVIRI
ncbi:MAG: calcium-binding protein [Planctomycetaceae bacterium]